MRRLVRALLAAAICTAMPVALAGVAHADAPDAVGWWWEVVANPGLSTFVPPPPNVPAGGMYLSVDPSGPNAIGAVHFATSGGESPQLTLPAAPDASFSSSTPVSACPATKDWQAVQKGDWGGRPTYKTDACVPGKPAADSKSMSWTLTAGFVRNDAYDVVLVPQGPAPFQVTVDRPGEDALTGAGATTGESTSTDESSSFATDQSGTAFAPDSSTSGDSSFVAPGPSGSFDVPPNPTPSPSSSGGAAATGNTPTKPPSSSFSQAAAASTGTNPDHRAVRVGALVLLAMLGAALWWLGGAEARPPRLLGSLGGGGRGGNAAAGDAGAPVRGIGRFARPRTSAAQRL